MITGIPNYNITSEDIINMNELNFNVPEEKKKITAFLYLRNCGIKNALDFSQCSYEDKEEFLLLFMKQEFNLYNRYFYNTWAGILGDFYPEDCILSQEEMSNFVIKNSEYIHMIKVFINSLILFKSIRADKDFFNIGMKVDNIKHTDFQEISIYGLYSILENHQYLFMILIDQTEVMIFDNLFNDNNSYSLINLINGFTPYNEILSDLLNILGDLNGFNN